MEQNDKTNKTISPTTFGNGSAWIEIEFLRFHGFWLFKAWPAQPFLVSNTSTSQIPKSDRSQVGLDTFPRVKPWLQIEHQRMIVKPKVKAKNSNPWTKMQLAEFTLFEHQYLLTAPRVPKRDGSKYQLTLFLDRVMVSDLCRHQFHWFWSLKTTNAWK